MQKNDRVRTIMSGIGSSERMKRAAVVSDLEMTRIDKLCHKIIVDMIQ